MTLQDLQTLIQQGEGYSLEFKQSIPSKLSELARELCAFANASGGTILVGVNDHGGITGISNLNNSIRSDIQQAISLLEPKLDVNVTELKADDKTILSLKCNQGPDRPYMVSGSVYIRNGPNSEKMLSRDKVWEFWEHMGKIFFDRKRCRHFKYPEDFDSEIFKSFLQKAGITDSLGEKKILANLGLISEDGYFRYATIMMFAKNVQRYMHHATIRCVLLKGTNKRYILDKKEIEGNIIEQFYGALNYIISKLNLRYDIEGQPGGLRKEVLEIPETVFREALINALCHRSYYLEGAVIMVEIYDDRVEISNPGGLIGVIPEKDFGHKSFSRNQIVFGLLQRIDLVEKVGSGIMRMRDAMKEAGLPEPVFSKTGFFTAIFYRPVEFEKWITNWSVRLNSSLIKILHAFQDNPGITKPELSDLIGLGKTSVDKHIDQLKALGLISREGSRKTGKWIISLIPYKEY